MVTQMKRTRKTIEACGHVNKLCSARGDVHVFVACTRDLPGLEREDDLRHRASRTRHERYR
jgi:hypothetical protein